MKATAARKIACSCRPDGGGCWSPGTRIIAHRDAFGLVSATARSRLALPKGWAVLIDCSRMTDLPSRFASGSTLLGRHAAEVANDPALRCYGAILALLHTLVAWWIFHGHLHLLVPTADAVCWPLVPGCETLRLLSPGKLRALVGAYGALGTVTAALFLRRRTTPLALGLLAALVALELGILALDFRLRRNQHYMALATTLAFLVMPCRRDTLRVLIVLYYVWAGVLKLDTEWLSGTALYHPVWFFNGPRSVVVACVYVVVLELVIVWGMLAHSSAWFWTAFAQVIVFHIFSYNVVGYFYPVLMVALLTIFVLCRWLPPPADSSSRPDLLSAFVRGRAARPVYATAAVLSVLQIVPYLYPGDVTLTGEGRLYALNMFDARVVCDAYADVRLGDGSTRRENLLLFGEPRTRCDPILVRAAALSLCRHRAEGRIDFVDLDVHLLARRVSHGDTMNELVDLRDFCARPPRYDPIFHNDWIVPVPR